MNRRRFLSIALAVVVAVALLPAVAFGASDQGEKVKVGCFPLNGFCDIAKDGTLSGYGIEYTDAVASLAGWDCEYVRYASWNEALDALGRGEINLVAPAQRTDERAASYAFDAFPIGTEFGSLLTLSTNDALAYEDYAAFNGLKVGSVATLVFLDAFHGYEQLNGFAANISYYKDTSALVAALNAGEVDAILANAMVKTDTMKTLARFGAAPYYYMANAQDTAIVAQVNEAIEQLSSQHPQFQNELTTKYFSDITQTPFSKDELNFIAESGSVKIACPQGYAPLSYMDSETAQLDGVDRAIFDQIAQISGLSFDYIGVPEGEDIITYAMQNAIPLVANIENDEGIGQFNGLQLTEGYMDVAKVFVGPSSRVFDTTKPATVAVTITSDDLINVWKERYPNFDFVEYAYAQECVDALRAGKVDMILHNRYAMESVLAAPQNDDLHIMAANSVPVEVCCGVIAGAVPNAGDTKRADALLFSILNKSIVQISQADTETYVSKYAQKTQYKYSVADFAYQYRIPLIAGAAALIAVFVAAGGFLHARRKNQQAIAENETKLRNITNNINGGVVVLRDDAGLQITYANDGFLEMIGCSRAEFESAEGGSYLAYVHPDDLHKIFDASASDQMEMSLELRVLHNDGTYIPALFNCSTEVKANGDRELYCVIMDMTEQLELMERLRIDNARTELILSKVEEIFYEVNLQACEIIASPSFHERLGWNLPAGWAQGTRPDLLGMWHVCPEDKEKLRVSTRRMLDERVAVSCVVRLEVAGQKRYIWCEISQNPILTESGSIASVIGLIRDVDDAVQEREALRMQAQTDALTGLYNKEAFGEMVTEALLAQPDQNHALIFVDLDHFKSVNDTLGHLVGDRAICEAAEKLRIIFSHYDILARFGGDEFCIFVRNIPTATLRGKLEWMVDKLKATYTGEQGTVQVTCSCGIACTEVAGFEYTELIDRADQALYHAKETGRNRYVFYRDIG